MQGSCTLNIVLTFDFLFFGYSHKFRWLNLNQLHKALLFSISIRRNVCNQRVYIAMLHAALNMMGDLTEYQQPIQK